MAPASVDLDLKAARDGIAQLREPGSCIASASAREIAELLGQFERTLGELSNACYALAPMIVPSWGSAGRPGRFDPGGATDDRQLSRESEALILSTLHELGATIGGSARRCRSARGTLVSFADRCDLGTDAHGDLAR
jgi:hypothetical protein